MRLLNPSRQHRLNEAVAVVYFAIAALLGLSLFSYHPTDPSWNAVRGVVRVQNLIGPVGAHVADLLLQSFGLTAFCLPLMTLALAWRWFRSRPMDAPAVRLVGMSLLLVFGATGLALLPIPALFAGRVSGGGVLGMLVADLLRGWVNSTGAVLITGAVLLLSLYLVSTFSMLKFGLWMRGPLNWWRAKMEAWSAARAAKAKAKAAEKGAKVEAVATSKAERSSKKKVAAEPAEVDAGPPVVDPLAGVEDRTARTRRTAVADAPPIGEVEEDVAPTGPMDIPIRTIEDDLPPWQTDDAEQGDVRMPAPAADLQPVAAAPRRKKGPVAFRLPSTDLLNEPPARNPFDEQELKEIAVRIKSKFEEFNVLGSVVQINPGPVVTTFEFKPEAGIKYSRITTLTEDLCLGLQAESILIERIPGKPTVGIEVPNSKREVISLRQILESDEFEQSSSYLSISLGKDISGRIKVTALESMPHVLIAGSTGSGKSVMLNTLIMSVLYKSTPNDVRMIMVDPKRVELGIYEGIPHLLTPVITDPKKATNSLRNAVGEMERRLKLLAALGVRNIDQYNKKVRQMLEKPRNLFGEDGAETTEEELRPLPFILIIIDELADLMMLERANVEESVTRLAQMARAVGMHLVLATQRPSVDVITGLIKANFPARISFRVATRVDSRTILDGNGAEHLLGKGDMLFMPPGSSRQTRVHGAFVTETEITRVVDFWKEQAAPEYDSTFLLPPPSDEDGGEEGEEFDGTEDPVYQDAVRVVLDMGKASTSILQRRLRLGYGRAARILDMMQRDGIIGPPDGSRPREVLKRPDWLEEVEAHPR